MEAASPRERHDSGNQPGLVAVVVLPATIGFSATVGFPLACLDEGILSLCRPHSPLYGESI